ncbi:diguanylate cyclase [Pseudomonas plecoglossicida]|nr:diguanylate cyclase [Pseudomonas plecoglossicida]
MRWLQVNAVPVGAAGSANTGTAGAIHRVACFAGLPAPTGTALASG